MSFQKIKLTSRYRDRSTGEECLSEVRDGSKLDDDRLDSFKSNPFSSHHLFDRKNNGS